MRISRLPTKIKEFVYFVKNQCKKHNVKLLLQEDAQKWYRENRELPLNGYFNDDPPELAVVVRQKPKLAWFKIFVHEYAHMTQWMEQNDVWRKCFDGIVDMATIVDLWLQHKIELTNDQKYNYVKIVQNLELDCEKRTVRLIKEFDLPIDIKEYIRDANKYVYTYTAVRKYRSWVKPSMEINLKEKIIQKMPTVFVDNYDEIPHGLGCAFAKMVSLKP